MFAASFVGAVVVVAAMFYSIKLFFVIVLVLAGLFINLQVGLLFQSIQEFVDPQTASTAVSLVSIAGWLGAFVVPVVAGDLVAVVSSYVLVFLLAVGFGVAGGFIVWQMAESGITSAAA